MTSTHQTLVQEKRKNRFCCPEHSTLLHHPRTKQYHEMQLMLDGEILLCTMCPLLEPFCRNVLPYQLSQH
uniref:PXA1 n=1 Tax=Arundo donax TaxID=35708 RepID=A0A0A9A1S9_ARUDO